MREQLIVALGATFLLVVGLASLAAVVLIGLIFGPVGLLFVVAALLLYGPQIALGIMHALGGLDHWARRRLGV